MLIRIVLFFVFLCFTIESYSQIKTIGDRYVGCAPDTFTFYTLGNTHSGQVWSSGNGNNSVLDTVVFLYSTPGTYKVKIGNIEKDIVVLAKLNLNFTTDSIRKGCFPYKFNLRDITAYPAGIFPTKISWVYQSGGSKIGSKIEDTISNYYLYYCFVKMIVNTNVPSCTGEARKDSFFEILDIPKAQIDISPDSACHVPFSPTINNRSKDSLKTNLTYLWKWNQPSLGNSTNVVPPPLTYTTNTLATYTLEAINKFGCKGFDTLKYKIDTPTLDFIVPSKICAREKWDLSIKNMDMKNYTYTFISDKRMSGQDIFVITDPLPGGYTNLIYGPGYRFKGYDGDFPDQNVVRKMTILKTLKKDTRCKVSLTKNILICQTFPKFKILQSKVCGLPFRDTIVVTNTLDPYKCWDSLDYSIAYVDKYKIKITLDSFNALYPDVRKRPISDSTLIYGLDKWDKVDSFYRRERLGLGVVVSFFTKTDTFACTHPSSGGLMKTEVLSPHLVNYYGKGCNSKLDSFRVFYSGLGIVTSIKWHFGDDSIRITGSDTIDMQHKYRSGKFRAYAVVTNSLGCIDTTNPVFIQRGDSVIPQFSISKRNFCITDSTVFTVNNKDSFDNWYYISDNNKTLACPNEDSSKWTNFYNAGKQYVYLIAEKNGCRTILKDSIYVDGPKFNLDYDFKCIRRDSIQFFLRDTLGIRGLGFNWNFGDGSMLNVLRDTVWHKYTSSNDNYWVKVSMQNPSGCFYEDSTLVKIRKVKAIFTDTLLCKQTNPDQVLNGTPYPLNPGMSQNADYICEYRYTWLLSSVPKIGQATKHFQPVTFDGVAYVHFPLDTMRVSLVARDINGCTDTLTRTVITSNNHIDFKMIYDSCPKVQTVQCVNLSTSPFGIARTQWDVRKVVDGIDTFRIDTSELTNPSFTLRLSIADTFKIRLKLYDSANCNVKELTKLFVFVIDTSKLIVPDTVCHFSNPIIYSNENDIVNYKYRWKVNDTLVPNDTTYRLYYTFKNLGKHIVRLEKTHRFKGCTDTFIDSTIVKPKPRLRIENSFDLVLNKCFPAITTIQYYDSSNIWNLYHKFIHNGSLRTQNPTTIALDTGVNEIQIVFTTHYGCYDSFVNYDTVYRPRADLSMDKRMICKNDSIQFKLINRRDVDSILWSFGDGYISSGTDTTISHKYTNANIHSDSIVVSFIVYAPKKACPYSKVDTILVFETNSSHHLNDKIDTAYCLAPVKIKNTAMKIDSIRWDFGDGNSSNIKTDSFEYKYTNPGKYKITQYTYRKPLGCVDSSLSTIILYPYPKLSMNLDTICLGQKLNINYTVDLPNTKVYLDPDTFKKSPYTGSPIITQISKNTLIILKGISERGCIDSIKAQANVLFPYSEKSWDTIIETGKEIILPVGYDPYWSYTWTPKWKDPTCENCANPVLRIFDSVVYNLTIEDYRKCFKSSYKYVIRLYPDILVRVPTAFSPNGDGNNDILYARGFGIKKLLNFKIFNRQGQLLFISNDERYGWDGNYKDIPQNSDVFYYTYEAESFIPGKVVSGEGNFMLLR
jgi:gliding motility-associated-like protein